MRRGTGYTDNELRALVRNLLPCRIVPSLIIQMESLPRQVNEQWPYSLERGTVTTLIVLAHDADFAVKETDGIAGTLSDPTVIA